MVKLTGYKKIKTAVFISGTGSNLKSLIKFSKTKKSPISINLIISNNPKAKGLRLGKINKIRKKYGISIDKNSVHGSDSVENAKIEIDFFFKD